MRRRRSLRRIAAAALGAGAAMFGYGSWFGATHGAVYFSIVDVSDRSHIGALQPVRVSPSYNQTIEVAARARCGAATSAGAP